MDVRSMCPRCGKGLPVEVGEAVPEHEGWRGCSRQVAVGFDPAWPPCFCHFGGDHTPPTWAHLRNKPIVLIRKYEGGMGCVDYVSPTSGCGGPGFPCSWSVEDVVAALRRIGVNVAASNDRVPLTWSIPAAGDSKDRVERCLATLRKAGVVPRRDVSLDAWM